MNREKSVALVNGVSKPIGSLIIKTTDNYIAFSGQGDIKQFFASDLVTDDGRTVGERQRAELHEMLDQWLDGTWVES
jgi:hypothetical protein